MLQVEKKYGNITHLMAHSMGGIAAALATEELTHIEKLVLIAPATETPRAIDNFLSICSFGKYCKRSNG
ncbi:MAG: hypothetical protein V9E96_05255 [Chitinophagaceae bacterium]